MLKQAWKRVVDFYARASKGLGLWFKRSLEFWEKMAHQMDRSYDRFTSRFNRKAVEVKEVAKPVFNLTYFFGIATYTFYTTLNVLVSLAPVALPLIAIFNIPFFDQLSSPLIAITTFGISCAAGYYKYTSLLYQQQQDEQIHVNQKQINKLKKTVKELKEQLRQVNYTQDQSPNSASPQRRTSRVVIPSQSDEPRISDDSPNLNNKSSRNKIS